jgi:hypothetical protein
VDSAARWRRASLLRSRAEPQSTSERVPLPQCLPANGSSSHLQLCCCANPMPQSPLPVAAVPHFNRPLAGCRGCCYTLSSPQGTIGKGGLPGDGVLLLLPPLPPGWRAAGPHWAPVRPPARQARLSGCCCQALTPPAARRRPPP